jgi:hypothetical protein
VAHIIHLKNTYSYPFVSHGIAAPFLNMLGPASNDNLMYINSQEAEDQRNKLGEKKQVLLEQVQNLPPGSIPSCGPEAKVFWTNVGKHMANIQAARNMCQGKALASSNPDSSADHMVAFGRSSEEAECQSRGVQIKNLGENDQELGRMQSAAPDIFMKSSAKVEKQRDQELNFEGQQCGNRLISNSYNWRRDHQALNDYSLHSEPQQPMQDYGCMNLAVGLSSEENTKSNSGSKFNEKSTDSVQHVVTPWPLNSQESYKYHHAALEKQLFSRNACPKQYSKYLADLAQDEFLVLPLLGNGYAADLSTR